MSQRAAEWEQTVTVVAHTECYFIGDDISLRPSERADVPRPWAETLVARGYASYVS
jgi:hypothetical protein